ncbi:MAG: hypothetical protein AAGC55_08945 [Myxococcota bacterium]
MRDHLVTDEAQTNAALAAMHRTTETRDSTSWYEALDCALTGLPGGEMVALAEYWLRVGLDTFERLHPDQPWPRRVLDGHTDDSVIECTGPGGNNFVSGVEHLVESRVQIDHPRACRTSVVDAIGEAIMAVKVATWGRLYPERWQQWYSDSYALEPKRYRCGEGPMDRWSEHPQVALIERQSRTQLADQIAAAWRRVREDDGR